MPNWTTFAGITGVVLILLLVLSYLTQSAFGDADAAAETDSSADTDTEPDYPTANQAPTPEVVSDNGFDRSYSSSVTDDGLESGRDEGQFDEAKTIERPRVGDQHVDSESLTTGMVLANVAMSQGLFALVLLGAVIYTGIPADALGIEFSRSYLESGMLLGTAFGVGLYIANELGAATATRLGFDHDEQLRELLAPESPRGWLVLLVLVLPIIAVFEELLFRAALIGVITAGFGISPWLLAIGSSIAFGIGHGMQGGIGIVVTGVLGLVLATVFIITGSFLVVVVAHYLINALELVVHERFGFEWAETLES